MLVRSLFQINSPELSAYFIPIFVEQKKLACLPMYAQHIGSKPASRIRNSHGQRVDHAQIVFRKVVVGVDLVQRLRQPPLDEPLVHEAVQKEDLLARIPVDPPTDLEMYRVRTRAVRIGLPEAPPRPIDPAEIGIPHDSLNAEQQWTVRAHSLNPVDELTSAQKRLSQPINILRRPRRQCNRPDASIVQHDSTPCKRVIACAEH